MVLEDGSTKITCFDVLETRKVHGGQVCLVLKMELAHDGVKLFRSNTGYQPSSLELESYVIKLLFSEVQR